MGSLALGLRPREALIVAPTFSIVGRRQLELQLANFHARLDVTQTSNRIMDEFARMMTDAAGAAQGLKREVETIVRSQGERILRDMDVVSREEFEAVRAMAEKARGENERLEARIAALEAALAARG